MPSWTKGRISLIGDAGYCASPAEGVGGILVIIGATAIADAFSNNMNDFHNAFKSYNNELRPFVERIQKEAIQTLDKLLPSTQEQATEIWEKGISLLWNLFKLI